ncbi:ethylene receptor 2-like [Punica granatum]|uniref:Ethylene receptor n=2 Tax=Punica granatum TaxID=22663 RepID=A0A218VS67_PUNGR|nr:ethylene receptor 2-like [Punica granatum]OWM63193.1 hypothetical protein CDL15_Pgr010593 [Punica granatum]PKI65906.1 hypothetical protein CRG98_013726 [Punica granatum]
MVMTETRNIRSSFGLLLILSRLVAISAADKCSCDDEGSLWTLEAIFMYQRTSDFLIAVAYFSIPVELLWFVSCSNIPFKWVLFEFIAFIVLCGLTHLLSGLAYGPHSFELMMALTVSKILTALVSSATAITLVTLIPLLLKVKVRELMLRKKAWDLGREVGIIMKQREAGLHVRMLTREIRKSLDRHTILYTTLIELSRILGLWNCAIWMPDEEQANTMNLTHELRNRNDPSETPIRISISMDDPDIAEIVEVSDGMKILGPDRPLTVLSSGGLSGEEDGQGPGQVAAIRMPMLRVSNFKGGTPELVPSCYAILVLVLPWQVSEHNKPRTWTAPEIEIVKVVADQVAVALSHASVLEESQLMREKLEEQNLALQQARKNAVLANQARSSFHEVMNERMRRPMHAVLGLLSILQHEENLMNNQKLIVDTMARTGNNLSIPMDDEAEISLRRSSGRLSPLEIKPFHLHSLIREMACLIKCLCNSRGFGFSVEVERSLPDHVMGDERRVFQVILHTVMILLDVNSLGGLVKLRVLSVNRSLKASDQQGPQRNWKTRSTSEYVFTKFEFEIKNDHETGKASSVSGDQLCEGVKKDLSFSICKRLVQMMQGDIWIAPNSRSSARTAGLILGFQLRPSIPPVDFILREKDPLFQGTTILVADSDDTNRAVTRKLLEKLGCAVSTVGSGFECLTTISSVGRSSFMVVVLELRLPGLDGFEVATRIRKVWSHNWPLILALTASSDKGLQERCLEIGMNGFIRKPVTLQGITEELQRVMSQANL